MLLAQAKMKPEIQVDICSLCLWLMPWLCCLACHLAVSDGTCSRAPEAMLKPVAHEAAEDHEWGNGPDAARSYVVVCACVNTEVCGLGCCLKCSWAVLSWTCPLLGNLLLSCGFWWGVGREEFIFPWGIWSLQVTMLQWVYGQHNMGFPPLSLGGAGIHGRGANMGGLGGEQDSYSWCEIPKNLIKKGGRNWKG